MLNIEFIEFNNDLKNYINEDNIDSIIITDYIADTNIYCNMNLAEYFKYKVETYNQHYLNCWTPAIWIDKELLLFLASINNFEYMIDYK